MRGAETPLCGTGRSNMPSSVIRSYRYDPQQKRLELVFVSGRRYRYHDVPEETYSAMSRAFSKGEFFNAHIRNQFRHTRES
ncbi:MAG TPA: KTSC domain-containing protein [Steroidobacteraceae bacterium]|nr:KTSC domain-containing protein [Steroidobacteraceae bacterium]